MGEGKMEMEVGRKETGEGGGRRKTLGGLRGEG